MDCVIKYLDRFQNRLEMRIIVGFPDTFKALSDPVRREILVLLRDGRLSAGDIAKNFDISLGTVSYHLSQLKKAGLIVEQKHKNFIYYELNTSVFEELILWMSQFGGKNNEEDEK